MRRRLTAASVRPVSIVFGVGLLAAGAQSARAMEPGRWYVAGAVIGSALDKPPQTIANAPKPGSTLKVVNDVDFGGGGQAEIRGRHAAARVSAACAIFLTEVGAAFAPPTDIVAALFGLTPSESRAFEAAARGETLAQMARTLGVAPSTAKSHLFRVYESSPSAVRRS